MQDRPREAGRGGEFRIGVQRVAIAAKAIDQRLVRSGAQRRGDVCSPLRQPMGRGARALRSAEAAVAAGEHGGERGAERLAARLFANRGLDQHDRALIGTLVERADHHGLGHDGGCRRQRPVQGDALLAVHHHHQVEATVDDQAVIPGDHRRHGRHRRQVPFEDERQLVAVHRVAAHADADGVEHGIPIGIGELFFRTFQRDQLIVVDGHGLLPILPDATFRRRQSSNR